MPYDFFVAIKELVLSLARDHNHLIAPLVFALGFGESIALVSLFVPSTILFLGIGAIHQAAGGDFVTIWLAGGVGAFTGDLVSYALGRHLKDSIRTLWPFSKYPGALDKAIAMDKKWGALALVGSKFVGMLRPFAPVMAGTLPMPLGRFLLASIAGGLLWAGTFLSPGFGYALWR